MVVSHVREKLGNDLIFIHQIRSVTESLSIYPNISLTRDKVVTTNIFVALTFIGCNIPTEVNIHPPNDVRSVGRSKTIKRGKEMNEKGQKKEEERSQGQGRTHVHNM
jgi:hypothetical protein